MNRHKTPAAFGVFTCWRRAAFALAAAWLLTSCAPIASVSETRPHFVAVPPGSGSLAYDEKNFLWDEHEQAREPLAALANYLEAAQDADATLQSHPDDAAARRDYNFALSRVFEVIRKAKLDPWSKPLTVPVSEMVNGYPRPDFTLTYKPLPRAEWNPALYDFIPADQIALRGTYVRQRIIKEGLGASLVAVGRKPREDFQREYSIPRVYYGVTAVARFDGEGHCVISFEDPLHDETATLETHTFPLAADFTAPIGVLLARERPDKLGLIRLLFPYKYAQTARVARLQPYDPNKAVVLVVHGLMDTPATWVPMLNVLRGDEEIRRNYQFWFYSYPSGYPYPYSAAIMREQLDGIEKAYPLRKKMVLIGHSMGGCISRLMVTDSGDKIWMGVFGKPPGEVHLSPESRKLATESLIFTHRKEVGRVIFISTPHRGSDLATDWIGRLGSRLVQVPATLAGVSRDMLSVTTFHPQDLKIDRIPNSVDTLAPNNRFVKIVNTIPITPGIPYNSIIGDRGRGNTPNSSDGVVPYWSSHLDGAQSELIVPSSHGAHQNPKAIAEVLRILKLNLKTSN